MLFSSWYILLFRKVLGWLRSICILTYVCSFASWLILTWLDDTDTNDRHWHKIKVEPIDVDLLFEFDLTTHDLTTLTQDKGWTHRRGSAVRVRKIQQLAIPPTATSILVFLVLVCAGYWTVLACLGLWAVGHAFGVAMLVVPKLLLVVDLKQLQPGSFVLRNMLIKSGFCCRL